LLSVYESEGIVSRIATEGKSAQILATCVSSGTKEHAFLVKLNDRLAATGGRAEFFWTDYVLRTVKVSLREGEREVKKIPAMQRFEPLANIRVHPVVANSDGLPFRKNNFDVIQENLGALQYSRAI
jgi:hypothetical protein